MLTSNVVDCFDNGVRHIFFVENIAVHFDMVATGCDETVEANLVKLRIADVIVKKAALYYGGSETPLATINRAKKVNGKTVFEF